MHEDELDTSQEMMPADPWPIPTKEVHDQLVRKIWRICIGSAFLCFLGMGTLVVVMKTIGFDSKDIVSVMLILIYVFLPAYGIGYVAPALGTSLLKMGLGLDISRKGIEVSDRSVKVLARLDEALEERLKKMDRLMSKIETTLTQAEKGEHPLFERAKRFISDELELLKEELRNGRNAVEDDLGRALDEGEDRARKLEKEGEPGV